jgi:hypothetical protein
MVCRSMLDMHYVNNDRNVGVSGYMYMYIFTTDRFHDFTPPNGKTPKLVKIVKI